MREVISKGLDPTKPHSQLHKGTLVGAREQFLHVEGTPVIEVESVTTTKSSAFVELAAQPSPVLIEEPIVTVAVPVGTAHIVQPVPTVVEKPKGKGRFVKKQDQTIVVKPAQPDH